VKEIELTKGKKALVDDDWWDNLNKRTQSDLTSHAVEMAAELLACDW